MNIKINNISKSAIGFLTAFLFVLMGGKAASATSHTGVFYDTNNVGWEYMYNDDAASQVLSLAFFDKPADMTTIVIPSLSEALTALSGVVTGDVETYIIDNASGSDFGITPRVSTANISALNFENTDAIIMGVEPMIDPDVEMEVIFGEQSIIEGAFQNYKLKLTNLNKVKKFGDAAFKGSTFNNSNVDLTITSGQELGESAFEGTNVQTLNINVATVNKSSFKDTALTSVTFGSNTNCIEYRAFMNTNLGTFDFSTTSIKTILGEGFANAGLTSIKLDGVEWLEWRAFADNDLTELYLPKSLTTLKSSSIFSGNTNLTKVTVAYDTMQLGMGWSEYSATPFRYMFGTDTADCIKELVVLAPYAEGESVSATHLTYSGAYGNIVNPTGYENFDEYKNVIRDCYFIGLNHVEEVTIGEGYEMIGYQSFHPQVNENDYTLSSDTALSKLNLPDSLKAIGSHAFMFMITKEGVLDGFPSNLEYIGAQAFFYCTGLTIDFDVPSLKVLATRAFYGSGIGDIALRDKLVYISSDAFFVSLKKRNILFDVDYYGIVHGSDYRINEFAFYKEMGRDFAGNVFADKTPAFGNIVFTEKAVTEPTQLTLSHQSFSCNNATFDLIDFSQTGWENIGYNMFLKTTIDELKLPNGLKTIKENAFQEAVITKPLVLPEGLETVESVAFYNSDVKVENLPESITTIGRIAFMKARGLTADVILPNLTTVGDSAFMESNVRDVLLGNKIESIGINVFINAPSLRNITIDFDINALQSSYEENNASFYLSFVNSFGVKGETEFGKIVFTENAVAEPCRGITGECTHKAYDSTISDYVVLESPYFYGIKAEEVDLSQTGWTKLHKSFFQDAKVGTIKLPETLETIGEAAFYQAEVENEIDMPDSVTSIGDYAFQWANAKIDQLPANLQTIGQSAFFATQFADNPVVPASVTSIAPDAFNADDKDIYYETFTFKNNMDATNTSGQMIHDLLWNADLGKLIIESENLYTLDAGTYEPELYGMTMEEAEVTALPALPEAMFEDCDNLKTVDMTKDENLANVGYRAFYNADSLEGVKFAPGLVNKTVGLGSYAFSGTNIESVGGADAGVDLSAALFTADESVFSNMNNLQSVSVPASFNGGIIPAMTFYNDPELKIADIAYGVDMIDANAFTDDNKLESIFIWGDTEVVEGGEGLTIPEVTDIYAYTTSRAEAYAGDEGRDGYEGVFYPLDEVLYLTSNNPKIELNEDEADFDKEDLKVYALRRDGTILESADWLSFTTAYPLGGSGIKFDGSDTTETAGKIHLTPVAIENLNFANENFANMTFAIAPNEEGEKEITLFYTDKYTEGEVDTVIEPYKEEEEDPIVVPDTGIATWAKSAAGRGCIATAIAGLIIVFGGMQIVRKRKSL